MKRACYLLVIILTAVQSTVLAQEYFSQPPAQFITDIPFRVYSGGVVMVRAAFDDVPDSLNFILDTGSGGISLDSQTVERFRIPTELSDRTIRGIAGMKKVRFANHHRLKLPGLQVDSLNFHVNDYEILTSVYGEKIDGIIGFSFFSRYVVKIDYDEQKLKVFTQGSFHYPRGGFMLRPVLATIPITELALRDHTASRARYFFDTGAGLCLLLTDAFVSDSLVFDRKKKMYLTQAEGLGGKSSMKLTTLRELKIGPYKFRKVPTYIFNDEYNVTSYPYLGGLIGNDLLRRFNVYLNYQRRDIYLVPNSHFREQFDYAYTGLGFYYINGNVTVTDIMKGSPAEKAGFKENDIIISINNNMTHNIQTYRSLLQQPGEKLKIVVFRKEDGKLTTLTLKVGNILK
ncbi:MAG: aspartyl protease family protein [Flavihumibacter sp.]